MTIEQMFEKWINGISVVKERIMYDERGSSIYNFANSEDIISFNNREKQQFRADIISLMESVVPEEKINSAEAGYQSGWNLCRSAILENINKMKGE